MPRSWCGDPQGYLPAGDCGKDDEAVYPRGARRGLHASVAVTRGFSCATTIESFPLGLRGVPLPKKIRGVDGPKRLREFFHRDDITACLPNQDRMTSLVESASKYRPRDGGFELDYADSSEVFEGAFFARDERILEPRHWVLRRIGPYNGGGEAGALLSGSIPWYPPVIGRPIEVAQVSSKSGRDSKEGDFRLVGDLHPGGWPKVSNRSARTWGSPRSMAGVLHQWEERRGFNSGHEKTNPESVSERAVSPDSVRRPQKIDRDLFERSRYPRSKYRPPTGALLVGRFESDQDTHLSHCPP